MPQNTRNHDTACPEEVLLATKIFYVFIKCVSDMDWKSCVNLGTHKRDICHHYSFLASTLKLDSSEQGARWEIIQQRQRNVPRSLNVLDGCRPELLKPWDALCKSVRERESCPDRKNLQPLQRSCTYTIHYNTINYTYIYISCTNREGCDHLCFVPTCSVSPHCLGFHMKSRLIV